MTSPNKVPNIAKIGKRTNMESRSTGTALRTCLSCLRLAAEDSALCKNIPVPNGHRQTGTLQLKRDL